MPFSIYREVGCDCLGNKGEDFFCEMGKEIREKWDVIVYVFVITRASSYLYIFCCASP